MFPPSFYHALSRPLIYLSPLTFFLLSKVQFTHTYSDSKGTLFGFNFLPHTTITCLPHFPGGLEIIKTNIAESTSGVLNLPNTAQTNRRSLANRTTQK